ncbi:8-oxo-dGTP diphosphatase [Poriferisphaera corsica]|uniref:8-oxo-dGTP diphosphatase n=1 Tax=Poriferisphaera corsica TaxID=2528020 RepID=A0A517YVB7_9BACT|nr:NUDIX hydrolase [Poriferisphaera corsica]QDU34191.1 8-oxo-dGTP diphosphatase [Poriferisphaera corsica]
MTAPDNPRTNSAAPAPKGISPDPSLQSVTQGRPTHNGRVHGVVVACYRPEDQKWLMIRRSAHVPAPLAICFPGGAREHGEPYETAALREMHEEIGADVELLEQVWDYDVPDKPLTLFGYLAKLKNPDSLAHNPDEVHEILWLTTEQAITHPDAIPNSRFFIENLNKALPRHYPV